jgi:hypothetical protein
VVLRIGGGQGFWGDLNDPAVEMVEKGDIQYLVCDYLAELTLSLMERQKRRDPRAGFARDFLEMLRLVLPRCAAREIRIIANAGGLNVLGAVEEAVTVAKGLGLQKIKIAGVLGDNLGNRLEQLLAEGVDLRHLETGENFAAIKDRVVTAHAYLGHEPIKECLGAGALVTITGRVADPSMFLAPLAYEYGWAPDDWDRLASGLVVGHLLECGGQVTGGNFDYDWRGVTRLEDLGYPIAEVSRDGEIVITKTPDTGGLVSVETCKEQLLYEVHDPGCYLTPDAVVDLRGVELESAGPDRVRVKGVRGKPRPDHLKVAIGYLDGYRIIGYLPFSWPDALEKARRAAEILMARLKKKALRAKRVRIDYLGYNALHGPVAFVLEEEPNEVVLRVALHTDTKEEAEKLAPEIAPFILNGPPGACFFGGRPRASEVIALWPTLVPRELVHTEVVVREV